MVYAAGAGIVPITARTIAGTPLHPPGGAFPLMQVSGDGKTLCALASNGFLDRISVTTGKSLPAIRIRGNLTS